jgi:hypothetical protein
MLKRDSEPNQPNYEELRKAHEQALQDEQKRQSAPQPRQQLDRPNLIDDTEAKLAAFQRHLEEKVQKGRITQSQMIYYVRRYSNELAIEIQRDGARSEPPKVERLDPDRLMADSDYRRQQEQKMREERAARTDERSGEMQATPERPVSTGRDRY